MVMLKTSDDTESACEHMTALRDVTGRFDRLPAEEKE